MRECTTNFEKVIELSYLVRIIDEAQGKIGHSSKRIAGLNNQVVMCYS